MKNSLTVIKPLKHRSKSAITNNMFQQTQEVDEMAPPTRQKYEPYDFVGPLQFRRKMISRNTSVSLPKDNLNIIRQQVELTETQKQKNILSSTINRNTILSNLHKQQQIELTKQARNIQRYKQYQNIWQSKKQIIKSETKKKHPILMDNTIKSLYVHPNQNKNDVVNNFIVHYWEMSLRNHHPILQRHIKGNTFEKVEKEKLLQLRQGIRKIQQSIPILPIQKLSRLHKRDLSINGKNKIKKEVQSLSLSNNTRYSVPSTARLNQQQVYKISYEGEKRWMGTQNL